MRRFQDARSTTHHRRGGAYILVLGVALLITVIGIGALLTTRIAGREANNATDWEEAGVLAQAAVEQAMSYLNAKVTASPTGWRAAFTSYVAGSGTYAFTQSAGRGTFSWAVKDEVDGNFSNNYQDPFRVYGIGKVNNATRVYSVTVTPAGSPLDVLRCGLHAGSDITVNGTITLGAGPISTNGKINTGSKITGNVECSSQSGSSGNVSGTLTTGMAAKTMPSSGMYSVYLAKATVIPWSSLTNSIAPHLLTPVNNPYASTNPDGIYSITVPSGQSLTISSSRIIGTLLISMSGGTLTFTGPIQWDPNRADYPILIVSGSGTSVVFSGSTTWLSESTLGMDLNGNGTTTDDLAPQYRGLVHVIGSTNTLTVNGNAYFKGTVVTDGTVTTSNQSSYISDPNLYSRPPIGYGKGDQLMIVPGSWIWDSVP
jgi:Tfp pilus assembly protein PilX